MRAFLAGLLGLGLLACDLPDPSVTVRRVAAFDHTCNYDRIHVIAHDPETEAFKLDVCGKVRIYRRGPAGKYSDITWTTTGAP